MRLLGVLLLLVALATAAAYFLMDPRPEFLAPLDQWGETVRWGILGGVGALGLILIAAGGGKGKPKPKK